MQTNRYTISLLFSLPFSGFSCLPFSFSVRKFSDEMVRLLLLSKHTHNAHNLLSFFNYTQQKKSNNKKNVLHPWLKFMIFNVFNLYCGFLVGVDRRSFIKVDYLYTIISALNQNNQFQLLLKPSGHVNFSINLNRPKSNGENELTTNNYL